MRKFYRTVQDPGAKPLYNAHTRLDTTVRAVYAMSAKADPLAFILALNLTLTAKEKAGEKITQPSFPLPDSQRAALITDDCVHAAKS